jgi:hypothetical protein
MELEEELKTFIESGRDWKGNEEFIIGERDDRQLLKEKDKQKVVVKQRKL